jgi:hypothetical protein
MTFWGVQGVKALAALGHPGLVDYALPLYVADNAYTLAEPGDFVKAFRKAFPSARAVLARFGVRP